MIYESPLIPLLYSTLSEKFKRKNHQVVVSQSTINALPLVDEDFRYFLPHFVSAEDAEGIQAESIILQHPYEKTFQGIDFTEDANQVTIKLNPGTAQINDGQSIKVSFFPGDDCNFGDGHACTYVFPSSQGKKVVFVSVHSGLDGEADTLRDLLEGTGINQGLYSVSEVQSNAKLLTGSGIALTQDNKEIDDMQLLSIVRIPPSKVIEYRSLPVEQTLEFAVDVAGINPDLFENDLIVLETCGWRLPDDEYMEGLENLTYSVYLIFMGMP